MIFELYYISGLLSAIFVVLIDCLILYTFLLLSNRAEEEKMTMINKSLKKPNDIETTFNIEDTD